MLIAAMPARNNQERALSLAHKEPRRWKRRGRTIGKLLRMSPNRRLSGVLTHARSRFHRQMKVCKSVSQTKHVDLRRLQSVGGSAAEEKHVVACFLTWKAVYRNDS